MGFRICDSHSFKLSFAAPRPFINRSIKYNLRSMPIVSWHDSLLLFSSFTSVVGVGYAYRIALKDPTESEAMQETMVRLTFVYWIVFCLSSLGDRFFSFLPHDWSCRLKILSLLCFMLTFCCLLSLPLHFIEQRQRQPEQKSSR